MRKKRRSNKTVNSLRIIAGRWRGSIIHFPESEGLRPTGDRIRETLFNWLQVQIPEAKCLDLFAGSGALGFEALSRGATQVSMDESQGIVVDALKVAATKLGAGERLAIHQMSATQFVAENKQTFDIVFLDPPFDTDLHKTSIQALCHADWLKHGCLIYMESPKRLSVSELIPKTWRVVKHKVTGDVCYQLLEVYRLDSAD